MKRLMLMQFNDTGLDARPKLKGWAPGGYIGRCGDCKSEFIGDKRAVQCAKCAYEDKQRGKHEKTNS